jgi:hypothetical protein
MPPTKSIAHEIPKEPVIEPRLILSFFYAEHRAEAGSGTTSESFSLDIERGDTYTVLKDGTYKIQITEKADKRGASITVRPAYLWVEQFEALVRVKASGGSGATAPQLH